MVPRKSYRSSIWLLVQSFFPSLGLLSVWMSQRGSPLELHSKPDKKRDRWSPCTDSTSANVHMHKVSAPTKEVSRSVKSSLDNLFEELIISMFAPQGSVHFRHCSFLQLFKQGNTSFLGFRGQVWSPSDISNPFNLPAAAKLNGGMR